MNRPPPADPACVELTRVTIGGLKGQFGYDDETFDDPDPDIQRMFSDDDLAAP